MRHGQSKSNVYGINDSFGDPENHLTEKGREEVAYSLKALSKRDYTHCLFPLFGPKKARKLWRKNWGIPIEKNRSG